MEAALGPAGSMATMTFFKRSDTLSPPSHSKVLSVKTMEKNMTAMRTGLNQYIVMKV
jgi:hypothetical protein